MGLEAMPLDQHIKRRHGERQARLKIRPAPMHHLFEMADQRQHREHCLHQHAVLPRTALTQFKVRGIALGGMEGVWLKNSAGSRCVAIVIAQEPTQALSTSHLTAAARKTRRWCNELIAETLMIPLRMIVAQVL